MIAQHSPTTQGSAHLPEARAPLMPPRPPSPALAASDAQSVRYVRIALTAWFSFGRGAHRAVRPPGQR
eukprot:1637323-Prymnesium_polylepis.1